MGARKRQLVGYADADWANDLDDRKSVSGGTLFWGNSVIMWFSRKQHMVCTSTAEAEIHAILEMVHTIGKAAAILGELLLNVFGETVGRLPFILNDNQPGLDAIKSRKGRTKHYDIKVKFIAEGIERGDFAVHKVSSWENIADAFTKPLRSVRFRALTGTFMANRIG